MSTSPIFDLLWDLQSQIDTMLAEAEGERVHQLNGLRDMVLNLTRHLQTGELPMVDSALLRISATVGLAGQSITILEPTSFVDGGMQPGREVKRVSFPSSFSGSVGVPVFQTTVPLEYTIGKLLADLMVACAESAEETITKAGLQALKSRAILQKAGELLIEEAARQSHV